MFALVISTTFLPSQSAGKTFNPLGIRPPGGAGGPPTSLGGSELLPGAGDDILHNQGDGQDGGFCPPCSGASCSGSQAIGPPAAGELLHDSGGNSSLIGAMPFDLGAQTMGRASSGSRVFGKGLGIPGRALSMTPMADQHGYGVSFAIGHSGTVSPVTGAFVHPFTLLTLPGYAENMGLSLRAVYLSNAGDAPAALRPFGSNFTLSGYDIISETVGSSGPIGATELTLHRGDGFDPVYAALSTLNPTVYGSPSSAQDEIYYYLPPMVPVDEGHYIRTLSGKRQIRYEPAAGQVAGQPRDFVRTSVTDLYGNEIRYEYDPTHPRELAKIIDTRGIEVHFTWSDVGAARRVTKIHIPYQGPSDTLQMLDPAVSSADELAIDIEYNTSALMPSKIRYFERDIYTTGQAQTPTTTRPTVQLDYDIYSMLYKLTEVTDPAAPIVRLENEYTQLVDFGYVVTSQAEGLLTSLDAPKHDYNTYSEGINGVGKRVYVDPIGTTVTLTTDEPGRKITAVQMESLQNPRDVENGAFSDLPALNWAINYSCCGLPSYIVSPAGREFSLYWNTSHGQLTYLSIKKTAMSREYKAAFIYNDAADPSALTSAYQVEDSANPQEKLKTTITYSRGSGGELMSATVASDTYTRILGPPSQQQVVTYELDSLGRLKKIVDAEGVPTEFGYELHDPPTKGYKLLNSIRQFDANPQPNEIVKLLEFDDLGRLCKIDSGSGRVVNFEQNTSMQTELVESLPAALKLRYDARGSVVARLRRNHDELDAPRPRPWVNQVFAYDALDRMVSGTLDQAALDASSSSDLVTTFTYQDDHRPLTVTYPHGATTRWVWDGYKRLYKKVIDESGIGFVPRRVNYDEDGLLSSVVDGEGNVTSIELDSIGLLKSVTDPTGEGRTSWEYDSLLRVSTVVEEHVTGPSSSVPMIRTEFFYNEATGWLNKAIRHLDPVLGNGQEDVIVLARNRRGQLIEKGLPIVNGDLTYGRGHTVEYDSLGRVQKMEDKNGSQHSYVTLDYEAVTGRLSSRKSYEAENDGSAQWPLRVYEHVYAYDTLDRITSIVRNGDSATQNNDPASLTHTFAYDSLGHRVKSVDAEGAMIHVELDGLGRAIASEEVGGGINIRTTSEFVQTLSAWETIRTDAKGFTTKFLYDGVGRVLEKRNPGFDAQTGHHGVKMFYDDASRLERTEDGRGVHVVYLYDAASRLVERKLDPTVAIPSGVSRMSIGEVFEYDAIGRRTDATTRFSTTNGLYTGDLVHHEAEWDALSRLTQEDFSFLTGLYLPNTTTLGVRSEFGNDLHFRRGLNTTGNGAGTDFDIDITPDSLGRIKSATLKIGSGTAQSLVDYAFVGARMFTRDVHLHGGSSAVTHTNNWTWDGQKRLKEWEVLTGNILEDFDINYRYNLEGRFEARIKDDSQLGVEEGDAFQLDGIHRLIGAKLGYSGSPNDTYANLTSFDSEQEFEYDLGQSREKVHKTEGGTTTTTSFTVEASSSRYKTVGAATLLYDEAGNCLYDGNYVYKYDFRHRLSEVYAPAGVINPPQGASSGSGGGRTQVGGVEMTRGHIDRFHRNFTRLHQSRPGYLRSGTGSLVPLRATSQDLTSGQSSQGGSAGEGEIQYELVAYYGYDAFNRRVVRILNEEGLRNICSSYDGWREFEESELGQNQGATEWTPLRAYVWGNGIDELLQFAVREGATWKRYTTHQDERANVVRLVDASGQVQEKYEYGPYGEVTIFDGTGEEIANAEVPYLYGGRKRDRETKLYYFRNRYYNTDLGRFMTMDPLGQWKDSFSAGNPYCYLGNAPGDFGDPLGLQVVVWIGGGGDNGGPGTPVGALMRDRQGAGAHKFFRHDQHKETVAWIKKEGTRQKKASGGEIVDVIIVGHSWGGDTALNVANELAHASDATITAITLDPVGIEPEVKGGVDWLNGYQNPTYLDALVQSPTNYVDCVPRAAAFILAGAALGLGHLLGVNDIYDGDFISTIGGQYGETTASVDLASDRAHADAQGYFDDLMSVDLFGYGAMTAGQYINSVGGGAFNFGGTTNR